MHHRAGLAVVTLSVTSQVLIYPVTESLLLLTAFLQCLLPHLSPVLTAVLISFSMSVFVVGGELFLIHK